MKSLSSLKFFASITHPIIVYYHSKPYPKIANNPSLYLFYLYTRTPSTSLPPGTLAASRSAVLSANPWSSHPCVPSLYSVFWRSRWGVAPSLPRA